MPKSCKRSQLIVIMFWRALMRIMMVITNVIVMTVIIWIMAMPMKTAMTVITIMSVMSG